MTDEGCRRCRKELRPTDRKGKCDVCRWVDLELESGERVHATRDTGNGTARVWYMTGGVFAGYGEGRMVMVFWDEAWTKGHRSEHATVIVPNSHIHPW